MTLMCKVKGASRRRYFQLGNKFWFCQIFFEAHACHDILSHFFDSLNYGQNAGKPNNNGLLRKKNIKGVILKHKGTRMAEDGEDWNGLEIMILKNLATFFQNPQSMT